jgi:DNA-binding MarR family transcriptional regulator
VHAHEAIRVHLRIASCYNLLMREARIRIVQRWGLTLPQFDVLAELTRAETRGFTFVELSRLLLVTAGNLTGVVDRLEARHLVRREADSTDRRIMRVALTDKGRTLTQEMLPRHRDDLAELLSFMPAERLTRLSNLLDRLKQGLAARALVSNLPERRRRAQPLIVPPSIAFSARPGRHRAPKERLTKDRLN